MRTLALLTLMLSLALATRITAGEAGFASQPVARKAGKKVIISFTVASKTDVEVAVLNAEGKVIRHLAAGVLGGQMAPPAPLKKGLAQSCEWDLLDDFGKAAKGGPYKVRVRAGLGMKLAKLFGGDLYNFGGVESLATDEDGNLFIEANNASAQGVNTVRVYNPDGSYQRTLLPFPADVEPGSMKDVARWDPENKSWYTRNLSDLDPEYYYAPKAKHPNYYRILCASRKTGVFFISSKYLHHLDYRGRVPGDSFKGRPFWGKKWLSYWGGPPTTARAPSHVAISPDGTYAYLAGPYTKNGVADKRWKAPHNLLKPGGVYRMKLTDPKSTMELFVSVPVKIKGDWRKGGVDSGRKTGPLHGITVDTQGRVYVCDRDNDQVVVYDSSAKRLGAISVEKPDLVKVHPKTGAIYVMKRLRTGYYRYDTQLFKFANFKQGAKPVITHPVTMAKGKVSVQIALSVSAKATCIWLSGVPGNIICLEDRGTTFVTKDTRFKLDPKAQVAFSRIAVNYETDDVYVSDGYNLIWHYDGNTGKGQMMMKKGKPFNAVDLSVGYDGNLYVRTGADYSGPLERLAKDLKPLPYATGTHVLSPYIYGRFGTGFCEKGVGCGPDGSVYNISMYGWQKYMVLGFGPDGKPLNGKYVVNKMSAENYKRGMPRSLKSALVGPIPASNGGIRVDLQGNYYVGLHLLPKGHTPPSAFAKDKMYARLTGSVVKFSSKGGGVHGLADHQPVDSAPGGLETKSTYNRKMKKVDGAVAIYPGISPLSGTMISCVCRVSRFDLDRYGRLALPSAMSSSVTLVDNSGNRILTFGKYGNYDSQFISPDSKSKKPVVAIPDIPLSWPTGVGFSEKAIYICDTGNRRVVRADFVYAAEEVVPVK
jgi:NHL repeat